MSRGRVVIAEPEYPPEPEPSVLDEGFERATRRLRAWLAKLDESPDCRVQLDPAVLNTFTPHAPRSVRQMLDRLAAGEPPRALWERGWVSRAAVDGLLVTLASHGAVQEVGIPGGAAEPSQPEEVGRVAEPEMTEFKGVEEDGDPLERENVRAQSAVSMHREPANRVSKPRGMVWRDRRGVQAPLEEPTAAFALETGTAPRVLGWAFAAVFVTTVFFLVWREGDARDDHGRGETIAIEEAAPVREVRSADASSAEPAARSGLSAFAGRLVATIDPALPHSGEQGALELLGPPSVRVHVDDEYRGTLPLTLALDEGRHLVRYETPEAWTYRVHYVERDATRVFEVSPNRRGFVDAR
jgi:hypothetical protein